ncbi:MAG: hypothetical protein IJX89_02835 [Alphaproteobacteria bacterium]|nr:hypothetical protein [Alphaproteobacteria bacterium]
MSLKRFCIDLICGFIPSRKLRRRVRVILRYPSSRAYINWVRDWAHHNDGGVRKMSIAFGVGCKNLVVIVNDKNVFKFSLTDDGAAAARREMRITDAFTKITPIRMPQMELIAWRGVTIRRQEFFSGKLLGDFEPSYVLAHREKIAKQMANFLHVVGKSDPRELRDLKPTPDANPGYLYGWFHNDIGQNFMMDDDLNITGFIDWENAAFCDWKPTLYAAERHWDKNGYKGLMVDVMAHYSKLFYADKQNQK